MASKDPILVGMVVVGHGRLAKEMVQTLETALGPVEALEAVATSPTESAEDIRAHVAAAVRRVDRGRGVLILTDMLGDTPTNQSMRVARETGAEVVAGINMPILVKVAQARRDMDSHALARFIKQYGQDHIFWATEPTGR
jgi:PTS system mannose-specific IIA component